MYCLLELNMISVRMFVVVRVRVAVVVRVSGGTVVSVRIPINDS
jgi:hypothetical protein